MEIISIVLSIVTLALVALLLARSGKRPGAAEETLRLENSITAVRQEVTSALGDSSLRLAKLVSESSAGMRQEASDRIATGLADISSRVESQLKAGREESGRTLASVNETLIKRLSESGERVEGRIAALDKRTAESLEAIRGKVDERLRLIGEQVRDKLDQNLKEGFSHFEKVQEHLKKAEEQLIGVNALGGSICELNSLLKLPHLRGGFGDAALEAIVNDFLPASTYELQAQVVPGSQERVDLLVRLPGASLPVDSKFPREQVLPLFEDGSDVSLAEARKTLARVIKEQAKGIADKYIHPECGTADMALMFLPSETLYFEVVRDAELWGALRKLKVFPVSPNTLAVTLNGLMLSHRYYLMAKGVEKTVEDIRKARKHFSHFYDQFEHIGKKLEGARKAYETAGTHLVRYSGSVSRLTGEPALDGPDDEGPDDLPLPAGREET